MAHDKMRRGMAFRPWLVSLPQRSERDWKRCARCGSTAACCSEPATSGGRRSLGARPPAKFRQQSTRFANARRDRVANTGAAGGIRGAGPFPPEVRRRTT